MKTKPTSKRPAKDAPAPVTPDAPRALTAEPWPIDRPKPYAKNPRRNDAAVEKVAASIREFGWAQPIVVDGDGVIIIGHTRLKAAKKLGLKTVPVLVRADLSPEQVAALRLADNKCSDFSTWDNVLLLDELKELEGSGLFTGFEIGKILEGATEELSALDEGSDENEVPEVDGELYTVVFRSESKERIDAIKRAWNEMESEAGECEKS